MARSKNDEILIDIGFNSDIDNFVKAIETKLKNADFGKLENISQGLKDINTNIDNLNNKKIDIKYEDPEDLDEILADLLNLQNTLNDGIKLDIGSGTARDKFKRFAGELIAEKQQLDKAMSNGILTIDDDYQVDNLTEYTKLLYNMLDVIKAIQERSKEKLLPGDLDIFNGKTNKSQKDIFGENIVDISTLQNNIEKELDKVKQIVNSEVHDVLSVSDNESGIPLYLKISTSKEVLIEQARQVITALKQYAKNNPIPIKLDLSSTIQSKTTTKQIKELERLLPNANDPEIKTQIEQLKNEISKNLTEGWSLRINTGELKEDTNLAKKAIVELEKAINDANDKLVLRPRIDIADETSKQLHDKLIKLNQLLDTDTKKAVDKVSKNLKKIGGGETQEFENNLENIITRFQDLANSADSLNSLKAVFEGMASFVQTFSGKQFLNEDLIKNLKGFKNAINITSKNGLGTQLELLNSNTAETEALSKALNTIVANLNTLKFDDVSLGVTDKDITSLIKYTNALVRFLTSFENIEKGLENGQLSGKLKQFVTTINNAFEGLDQDKLSPLNLLKFDTNDNTGLDGALSELETFISKVEEARTQYNNAKKNLDNNKIKTATESVVDISKDITKLNTTAKANGVISVLNDVLKRGGELDKLIKLFNSPFGKSVNAPLELPKINTQKAAKSLEDNIYKDGGKLKGLYDKYIKNNDVANLEAFYRELEKVSNEYFDLRKAKRDGFIDENSFKAASTYVTAIIQELEQISGFQFPKLKTKRMDMLGMSENKNEFAKYIADSKEFEAVEKDVFTSLDKEATSVSKDFDKLYNSLRQTISGVLNEGGNFESITDEARKLFDVFQRLEQLNKLGFISDSELNEARNNLQSIGEIVDKYSDEKFGLNLDEKELQTYSGEIVELKDHIRQLLSLLSNGASTNELIDALSDINNISKSIQNQRIVKSQEADNIKEMAESAEEYRKVIKDTKNLQTAFFNKQDVVSMHEFTEGYEELLSKYNQFQGDKNALNGIIGDDNVAKIEAEFEGLFNDLNNGFLNFVNKIKKLPISSELKAQLNAVLQDNPFGGSEEQIKQWATNIKSLLGELGNSLNIQGNNLSFNKILGKIYNDLNKNSNATKSWKDQMRALAKEMESIGSDNTAPLALKAFAERYQKLDTQLKQSGQTGKDFFHKLSDNMQHQTTQLIAMTFSFYRLIGAIRQGFQTVTEFDSALAKISYTMDVSDKSLSNMGDTIIKLSKDLSTSITSMEQVYTIYANMNTSPEEIETLSKYTAVLANLSGIDASTAADDIQAVVNQFENLNSTDTSHIVDVFDYISRNISVDYQKGIEGMAEGVQAVGNVADKAGLSYEQLSAIIAKTMEQTRNSGSSIANGLKTIMVRLSKASSMDDEVDNSTLSKASAVLHDIGVEVYTTEGQFREFDTIMTELAAKWDSLTEAQQANISFQIAATRQTAVLKAILQNWTKSMDLATGAVETNGNALENQEKYADTYAAKMQNIKNSLTELSITAFDDTGFKTMLDWVNNLAQAFTKLVDTIGTVPTAIAGIGAIVTKKFIGISDITDLYKNVAFNGKGKKELPDYINKFVGNLGDTKKLNELTSTLAVYNKRIVEASIANSKLSASEKELIATEIARQNALININTEQLAAVISEGKYLDETSLAIMAEMGEAASINALTETKAREILTTHEIVGAEQDLFISRMQNVAAANAEARSSLSNFIAGVPKGIIALTALAATLAIVYAVYKKFTKTQKEYAESLTDSLNDYKEAQHELESLESQLDSTQERLEELHKLQDNNQLTLTDKEEITKLEEENRLLNEQILLAKTKRDLANEELLRDVRHGVTDGGYQGFTYKQVSGKGNRAEQDYEDLVKENYSRTGEDYLEYESKGYEKLSEAINKSAESLFKLEDQQKEYDKYTSEHQDDKVAADDLSNIQDLQFEASNKLTDAMELAQKKIEAYRANETKLTAEEKQELEDLTKALEDYNYEKYKRTGDKTYLNALGDRGQALALTDSLKEQLQKQSELLNLSSKDIDKYSEKLQAALNNTSYSNLVKLRDVSFTISKEDLKKIDNASKDILTKEFNIDGRLFNFDVSKDNAQKYDIEKYVRNVYAIAMQSLEKQGRELTDDNIYSEMLKTMTNNDTIAEIVNSNGKVIGEEFVKGIVSVERNPFKELIDKQLKQAEQEETKISFEDAWAKLDDEDADSTLAKLKENLTKLADEGKLTRESFLEQEGAETWVDQLNISTDEAIQKINDLSKDTTRLTNMKNDLGKLQNAMSEKKDAVITNQNATKQNEKINQVEAASASTISDLEEVFGKFPSWKKFKEVIGSTTSTMEECQDVANALATEYYNLGLKLNEVVDANGKVNESTRQYYISQLDELGIANAEEVVDAEIYKRKIELKLAKLDLKDATAEEITTTLEEIDALDKEGVSAEYATNELNYLVKQKLACGKTSIENTSDLSYLNDLITNAKLAGYNIDKLKQAKEDLRQAESIGSGGTSAKDSLINRSNESFQDWLDDDANEVKIKTRVKEPDTKDNSSDSGNKSSSNAQKKTKETIDWIERYIEEAQQRIDLSSAKLANTFGEKNQNKLYNKIIKNYGNIVKAYKVAGQKYSKNFNYYVNKKGNKKLFTDDLVDKIKNGRITGDASKLIQTYGEKNGKKIKEAIDRWKKYNDALVKEQEAITNEREKRAEKQQKMADRRQAKSELNKLYAEAEEKGYKKQNSYLKDAEKYERASLKKLLKKAKIEKDVTEQKKIQEQLAQLDNTYATQAFDNIIAYYDRLKGVIQDRTALTQSLIDLASARGANANISLYRDIKKNDADLMEQNKQEIADAQNALKKLTKGSQEYRDKQAEINNLLVEQNNLLADQAQQNKNILDTYTRYVDAMRNSNNRMANEVNFVDGLLDYAKHTSDEIKGFFTDAGYAALVSARKGLFTSQENAEIDKKNYEIFFNALHDEAILTALDAEKSITLITANGTETIIDSRKELQELADKAYDDEMADLKSIYDYQSKIVDLEKEKYTEELNLVKKLIDAKKEELDAEKDLHDYQKTISEKATNITNLERQLAAYSGNTSEEGRAKLQSLQQQLKEAQEDLNETEYDRYISDQKNMLEDLQKQYEDAVNKKLEDFMALLKEGIADVNNNMDKGNNALIEVAKQYGYDPQYKEATTGNFGQLKAYMKNNESELYKISGLVETTANNTSSTSSSTNGSNIENTNPKVKNRMETTVKVGNDNTKNYMSMVDTVGDSKTILKNIAKVAKDSKYFKKDQNNISDVNKLIKKKYGKALTTEGLKAIAEILDVPYNKNKNGTLWKALKQLGFAKGGIAKLIKRNGDDGIATLKRGEAVLTPLQTKQFQLLTSHLSDINRLVVLQDELLNKQNGNTNVSYGNITFEFNLPNVTDSQQFVSAIQNDVKVQKAIQSVTIDKIYKKSTLYNSKLNSKSIK